MVRREFSGRVAMVSEHASPLAVLGGSDAGGQNVHVAALARHVAALGAEVEIFTRRDDPSLPPRVRFAPGVDVVHVDAGPPQPVPKDELLPYMGEFGDHLRAAWSRHTPDIVHAHFWMSGLASLQAARPLGLPVVLTFHALGVVKRREQGAKDTSPRRRLAIELDLVNNVDCILATCSDETFELVRFGADRSRISVVPCGVDLTRFCPDGPAEPRRPGFEHRIVVVGRMVERKGIGNVITALASVPDTELVIAGGPSREDLELDPEARRLIALARHLGVDDRVELLGAIAPASVPALLRSADVVVCVPWYEPFGIVPLEAMACGRPVLASAVGGLVDTVVDDLTGVHVPPRDLATLAGALRSLLADDRRRQRMGAAGIARAGARYGWDRIASDTLACYRRLMATTTAAVGGRP